MTFACSHFHDGQWNEKCAIRILSRHELVFCRFVNYGETRFAVTLLDLGPLRMTASVSHTSYRLRDKC